MQRKSIIIGAVMAFLPCLFFLPGILSYIAISDSFLYMHFYTAYIFDEFLAGRDPLWLPYLFCGFPIVADPLQNLYQPLNWVFALFNETTAMNLLIVLTYSLGMVFTFAFARSALKYSHLAASMTAAAYIFGGYVFGWFPSSPQLILPAAVAPATLLVLSKMHSCEQTWKLPLLMVLLTLSLCLGFFSAHPQIFLYMQFFAALYFLYLLSEVRPQLGRLKPFFAMFFGYLFAGVIFMCQVLPTFVFSQSTVRDDMTYEWFIGSSMPPANVPATLLSIGATNSLEFSFYIGLVPALLALLAAIRLWKTDSHVKYFSFAASAAALFAMGGYTPLAKVLFHVPGFNMFSAPARWASVVTLYAALLAGKGLMLVLERIREGQPAIQGGERKGIIAILALAIFMRPLGGDFNLSNMVYFLLSLFLGGAIWLYIKKVAKRESDRAYWPPILLALFIMVEPRLFAAQRFSNFLSNDAKLFRSSHTIPEYLSSKNKGSGPGDRVFTLVDLSSVSNKLAWESAAQNVSLKYRIHNAAGYQNLLPTRYDKLMGGVTTSAWLLNKPRVFSLSSRIFDILSIQRIVVPHNYLVSSNIYLHGDVEINEFKGIIFGELLELHAKPDKPFIMALQEEEFEGFAIVNYLSNALEIPQGEPTARISFFDSEGKTLEEVTLKAGVHTAEWGIDKVQSRPRVSREVGGIGFYDAPATVITTKKPTALYKAMEPIKAHEIALISHMGSACGIPDGERIAKILLGATDGTTAEVTLRAGEHTSDWISVFQGTPCSHKPAQIAEKIPAGPPMNVEGAKYLTRLSLEESKDVNVVTIELIHHADMVFSVTALSLITPDGTSVPLKSESHFPRHKKTTTMPRKKDAVGDVYFFKHVFQKPISPAEMRVDYLASTGSFSIKNLTALTGEAPKGIPLRNLAISLWNKSQYDLEFSASGIDIFNNLNAMPRVWITPFAYNITPEEILSTVATSKLPGGYHWDPLKVTLVEDKGLTIALQANPRLQQKKFRAEARFVSYLPNTVEIEARTTHNSLLVLSEAYDEGWKLKMDGRDTRIFRVNYMLRGVLLTPGQHLLKFEYKPESVRTGRLIALAGILSLLILAPLSSLIIRKISSPKK